tara:strand:- start:1352 stop:3127 length:1776 start_codon:yes stop_codon:yes gene_type:complete
MGVLDKVRNTDVVVLDVETSGLDWKTNYIVGYVITTGPAPEDTYYIPVRHRTANLYDWEPPIEGVAGFLKKHPFEDHLEEALVGKHVIGHNLAFDLKFMHRHDIDVSTCRFEDTMINAALINELRRSYSLENCCIDAGVQPKRGGPMYEYLAEKFGGPVASKQMGNLWKLDGDDKMGIEYAMGDGISTWQLWADQQKDLDDQNLRVVWDVECRCIMALFRMMVRGVKVDEDRLEEVTQIIQLKLEASMAELPEGINLRSGPQMKKLFDDAGITDYPTTEKGNPSFAEHWLLTTELGRHVVASRKYGNLLNSFIAPMQTHMFNGRVYTEFNQSRSDEYGTITGRLSSSRPNMQQVPKRNVELGKLFRAIFIPDEDMVWASVDYSQCEPRLLAHYSKCKVLVDGYLADPPVDAHSSVAKAANIDRTSGKRVNQGLLTGMGKAALVMELGPDVDGDKIYDDYFKAMPEIKTLQRQAATRMKQAGYVRSLLGRRARYDTRSGKDTSYKAVNRLLQCGNADIIKKAMVEIDELFMDNGDKVQMLLSVHDAIDFQFLEEDRWLFEKALDIMRNTVTLLVPMEVDVGEGSNWSEASYG